MPKCNCEPWEELFMHAPQNGLLVNIVTCEGCGRWRFGGFSEVADANGQTVEYVKSYTDHYEERALIEAAWQKQQGVNDV